MDVNYSNNEEIIFIPYVVIPAHLKYPLVKNNDTLACKK